MGDILGVTFDEQSATPKNDARIYRRLLADGIVTGCAITKSGNQLTIAAGGFIACGRYMELAAPVTLTIDQEITGYARVKVVIDTTQAATDEVFEQAAVVVEYNATTSFPALTQDDVNAAGTTYEMEFARVSLNAGGINVIVSQAPICVGGILLGTVDLEPGVSALPAGMLYFYYEEA